MRRSTFALIILSVFVLVSGILVFRAMRNFSQKNRELIAEAENYNENLRTLYQQQSSLENKIKNNEKFVTDAGTDLGSVVLLFAEPDRRLETDVFPILAKNELHGVIAVSAGDLANTAENLSAERLIELQQSGWEICLSATEMTDLAALYREVTNAGIAAPATLYLPDTALTETVAAAAAQLGITTVIRHGGSVDGEILYELPSLMATGSFESKVSDSRRGLSAKLLSQAAENSGAIVLTVGYRRLRDTYEKPNFENMLASILKSAEKGTLKITDCADAWARLTAADDAVSSAEQAHRDELAQLREELAAVKARIYAIAK